MIYLKNDYSEGAHPKILEAFVRTNHEQHIGYGEDDHTKNGANLIKKRFDAPDVDVHFLVGGTQTNRVCMTAFLRPFEAVIATNLGHVSVHETGAIEASGHKVIEMPSTDAKMTVDMIAQAVNDHPDEHMVKPRLVYISNATELGTVYTKKELQALKSCCEANDLLLYIDGARLATAITAQKSDLTLEDIPKLCDAFYIGGTKNGGVFGEAMVIVKDELKSNFRFYMKQNGALLAKGRYLGIQFEEFFTDDLYLKIAKNANDMAQLLTKGLQELNIEFVSEVDSNMIFVRLPHSVHQELSKLAHYEVDFPFGADYVIARFVTSFATPPKDVEALLHTLKTLV